MMENTISIVLALIALVGNCGWIVSARKYRQEVRKASAEAGRAEFDLSADYVKEFREQVYIPLARELSTLRRAMQKVTMCKYYAQCPAAQEMYKDTAESEEHIDGTSIAPAQ